MTYCVSALPMAVCPRLRLSDQRRGRQHRQVLRMTVFERVGARVLTLLSPVISVLRQRAEVESGPINL
jgi:hypothetical protein